MAIYPILRIVRSNQARLCQAKSVTMFFDNPREFGFNAMARSSFYLHSMLARELTRFQLRSRSGQLRLPAINFIAFLTLLLAHFEPGAFVLAQQDIDQAVGSKIETYLRSFDADQFQERELGLQGLSSMGPDAIRPLAVKIITGTPESAWRSKLALEAIGIRGDEESFLKTACVLKLLFIGANETLTQRIADLEIQWRLEQKRNILVHLQSKGARVIESPQQMGGIDGDLILLNAMQLRPTPDLDESIHRGRFTATKVSSKRPSVESIREVDEILDASIEENRGRLFGNASPDLNSDRKETEIDPEILMELQLQRRFGVPIRGQIIGRNPVFPFAGITVVLDKQWKGDADDLRRATALSDFRRVEIDQVDLPVEEFQILAEIPSIVSVKLVGDQIASEKFDEIAKFKKVFELEVADRKIAAGELATLEKLAALGGLTLRNCQLSGEVVKELEGLSQLTTLALVNMKIAPDVLANLAEVRNLRLVNLELCKFQIDAYRTLSASRPELEIVFTPQALLGVRGPLDLSKSGCEISQVVPNSGAELGGLKPGDVVLKVNGHSVEDFEDLRLHVAQHQAGDVLSLVVSRAGTDVELKIQLSPFEAVD